LDSQILKEIQKKIQKLADKQQAQFLQRFFKTGPGQYGAGDIFLGIRVPQLRKLAKECNVLSLQDSLPLLTSSFHEERLLALLILIQAFSSGDESTRKQIYETYLTNTKHINNWDIVDISAPHIVGAFLLERDKNPLYKLAKSPDLWERRISIIATFHFIKRRHFTETLKIAGILLRDKEDLIHKAAGWMLREIGKRDIICEEIFLKEHCRQMPRTMLRYAIEKFPESKRRMYLSGAV
jgi:3-methyladenine DNA glycosylase AlkD